MREDILKMCSILFALLFLFCRFGNVKNERRQMLPVVLIGKITAFRYSIIFHLKKFLTISFWY